MWAGPKLAERGIRIDEDNELTAEDILSLTSDFDVMLTSTDGEDEVVLWVDRKSGRFKAAVRGSPMARWSENPEVPIAVGVVILVLWLWLISYKSHACASSTCPQGTAPNLMLNSYRMPVCVCTTEPK